MNYLKKYLKYKQKYISLKNKLQGGRTKSDYVVGINFVGGKIIKHIKKYLQCLAYANLQITMDAPYHSIPRVADEALRNRGRSEQQFDKKYGYNEEKLCDKLQLILEHIKRKYHDIKLVIQIARGKAAISTENEIIIPILNKCEIKNYEIIHGYRTSNYYIPKDDTKFIFINYGMFAELSENIPLLIGEICNPVITYDIQNYNKDNYGNKFIYDGIESFEEDPKNILNQIVGFKKLILYGISDTMPFITPEIYCEEHILPELVESL
jgi:hypothetical protein